MRTPTILLILLSACGGRASVTGPAADPEPIDAHGGRIIDNWVTATKHQAFQPDDKKTPGVADGKGGPNGDGTLPLGDGEPLLNDTGHDYRLKNFFGWDLRGRAGIYGPSQMNKAYAAPHDLLAWQGTQAEIADRLARGDESIPGYAAVLSRPDLEAVAAFIVKFRDGALPRPDDLFTLTSKAEGHYALRPGGDATRGKTLFAARCAECHGDQGTTLLFDDGEFSLGTHSRQKAYEDWFKILNGQPGEKMKRQVLGDRAQMTQEILDLFAALCDRQAFPAGKAKGADVGDGDARCGAYLR